MSESQVIALCRRQYRRLLRFHSRAYRERFAESMEQTFHDLCRERVAARKQLFGFVLWLFAETFIGVVHERARSIMQKKTIVRLVLITGCILLVPSIAMQFTDEVVWNLPDFVVAGALLMATGLAYEFVSNKGGSAAYRAAAGVAVSTALLLVWMNLAVGLIGNEENPANLLYGIVLLVALAGVFWAKFQPREMALTLFATALAQVMVPIIAMLIWRPQMTPGVIGIFVVNTFFVVLWVMSGLLFRHAGGGLSPNGNGERGPSVP